MIGLFGTGMTPTKRTRFLLPPRSLSRALLVNGNATVNDNNRAHNDLVFMARLLTDEWQFPLRAHPPGRGEATAEVRPARRIGNAGFKYREIAAFVVSACGTKSPH